MFPLEKISATRLTKEILKILKETAIKERIPYKFPDTIKKLQEREYPRDIISSSGETAPNSLFTLMDLYNTALKNQKQYDIKLPFSLSRAQKKFMNNLNKKYWSTNAIESDLKGLRGWGNSLYTQTKDPFWLKRQVSGRHAPVKGEALVAASPFGEKNAIGLLKKKDTNILFRGNPIPTTDHAYNVGNNPVTFFTPHPDLGAGYSTVGEFSRPSNRLFVYDAANTKNKFTQSPSGGEDLLRKIRENKLETPEVDPLTRRGLLRNKTYGNTAVLKYKDILKPRLLDSINEDFSKVQRMERKRAIKYKKNIYLSLNPNRLKTFTYSVPDYETFMPLTETKKLKQLGEYAVRPSRTAEGYPAYAVKRVSGRPAQQIFKGMENYPVEYKKLFGLY